MKSEWCIFHRCASVPHRWLIFLALVMVLPVGAQETATPTTTSSAVHFRAIDIYIDSKDRPLAAYQFELKAGGADAKIVGVEGGQHPAFADAPYYDPAALHNEDRILIAAFNMGSDLPKGKTRIARLHVQVTGDEQVKYSTKLMAAASADGKRIEATLSVGQSGQGENP